MDILEAPFETIWKDFHQALKIWIRRLLVYSKPSPNLCLTYICVVLNPNLNNVFTPSPHHPPPPPHPILGLVLRLGCSIDLTNKGLSRVVPSFASWSPRTISYYAGVCSEVLDYDFVCVDHMIRFTMLDIRFFCPGGCIGMMGDKCGTLLGMCCWGSWLGWKYIGGDFLWLLLIRGHLVPLE